MRGKTKTLSALDKLMKEKQTGQREESSEERSQEEMSLEGFIDEDLSEPQELAPKKKR